MGALRSVILRVRWLSTAVLVIGLLLTCAAAVGWHQVVERREEDAFAALAANAERVVAGELQRQDDLLVSVAAMVAADPEMTNSEFARWFDAAGISERFPASEGLVYIERVPLADLPAFGARVEADPVTGIPPSSPFTVVSERIEPSHHCLQRLGVWQVERVDGFVVPAGLDFCSPVINGNPTVLARVLERATITGTPIAVPLSDVGAGRSALVVPVYDSPTMPGTVDARRALLSGWVTSSFATEQLVGQVAQDAPGLLVQVGQQSESGTELVASTEPLSDDVGRSRTTQVQGGTWTITVAEAGTAGLSADVQALGTVVCGAAISFLLFGVLRVLSRSREQALEMVREKTEMLEHQALHDGLTGLANRTLLLDRAVQMLARRHGPDEGVAVLFIDLDDFKSVNDNLGHAAGDAYLRSVASRLQSVVRDGDTVGRLGGDEFVLLVECDDRRSGPELVARRVLDALGEPIVVNGAALPVSCSIGVAVGAGVSAHDLLHDADLAMYDAKLSGKGTFVVFRDEMRVAARQRTSVEWDPRGVEDDELSSTTLPASSPSSPTISSPSSGGAVSRPGWSSRRAR
jgi:diguanylate cyclase (GGDEF)-like protein